MKTNHLFLLAALLLQLNFAFAQSKTDIGNNEISVVGVGSVSAFPNAAELTLSIRFVRPKLRDAIIQNQQTTKEVLAIVRKYVKDTSAIRVSFIATDKDYEYNQALKKSVLVGFVSSQRIIFTLTDLSSMQDLTEQIITKVNSIESISYFNTEGAKYVRQAQEMAVKDAMETTERLARAANIKPGKILYMNTESSPATARNTSVDSEPIEFYGKSERVLTGIKGVSSAGQLIEYTVNVSMLTGIE